MKLTKIIVSIIALCLLTSINNSDCNENNSRITFNARLKIDHNYVGCGFYTYSICLKAIPLDSNYFIGNAEIHVVCECPEKLSHYALISKFKVVGNILKKTVKNCLNQNDKTILHIELISLSPIY